MQVRLCALKIQSESEEIKPGDIDYRYGKTEAWLAERTEPVWRVKVETMKVLFKSQSW